MKFIFLSLGTFAELETCLFGSHELIMLVDTKNNFVSWESTFDRSWETSMDLSAKTESWCWWLQAAQT